MNFGSLRAPEPGNRSGRSLAIKLTYGKRATVQAVTRVKLEQASKACACGIRPREEGTLVGVGDDGIATSNGSRPSLQWWIATPFESLVPSFVPKSVVTVGRLVAG